jgi:hypothetical protein
MYHHNTAEKLQSALIVSNEFLLLKRAGEWSQPCPSLEGTFCS